MRDIREQIEKLREQGWVGKQFQREQADTMELLNAVYEAAVRCFPDTSESKMGDPTTGGILDALQDLQDALAAIKEVDDGK